MKCLTLCVLEQKLVKAALFILHLQKTQHFLTEKTQQTSSNQSRPGTYVKLVGVCALIGQIPLQSVPIRKLDEGEQDDMQNK